jgi:hypothetical protein
MSSRRRSGAAAREKADDPETGKQHGVVVGLGTAAGRPGVSARLPASLPMLALLVPVSVSV